MPRLKDQAKNVASHRRTATGTVALRPIEVALAATWKQCQLIPGSHQRHATLRFRRYDPAGRASREPTVKHGNCCRRAVRCGRAKQLISHSLFCRRELKGEGMRLPERGFYCSRGSLPGQSVGAEASNSCNNNTPPPPNARVRLIEAGLCSSCL